MTSKVKHPSSVNTWYRILPVLLLSIFSKISFAQDITGIKKDSTGIKRAIYWAKKGEHEKAKQICQSIIRKYPHNAETEILLSRLYSWDKQFDSARIFLTDVINHQPANEAALQAIINVELWSNHLDKALVYCNTGLAFYPNSEELLIKKAKLYNKQSKYKDATKMVEQVLSFNPNNQEAIQFREYLKKKINTLPEKNGVGLSYLYDRFNNMYAPWNFGSLYFFHRGEGMRLEAGVNYFSRFHSSGTQYELNLYPKISSSMRAFIGGAYSKDSVFPLYNLGVGLYHKLYKKGELEVGARYLNFSRLPYPIMIYTGAFSMSTHRFWASIRTYLTPQHAGINQSYYLTVRYYMPNPQKYLALTLNTGLSPHDYLDPISGKTYNYPTRSKRIKMAYQTVFLSAKNILKLSVAYEKRDYYLGNSRERISTGLGFERLF